MLDQTNPVHQSRTLSQVFKVDKRKLSMVINNAMPDVSIIAKEEKMYNETKGIGNEPSALANDEAKQEQLQDESYSSSVIEKDLAAMDKQQI